MKEENSIDKKVGKDNAFKVPEGYFELFTADLLSKLPEREIQTVEEEKVGRWTKLKPFLYMAAMFIGAALIIRVASFTQKDVKTSAESEVVSDQMIDTAVEGAMMDDYSLYVYLTDPNVE